MRLKVLINLLNNRGKAIKGVKFDGDDEHKNAIKDIIEPVIKETGLEDHFRYGLYEIRFIYDLKDKNVGGSVGERLIEVNRDFDTDKRVKYKFIGRFQGLSFSFNRDLDPEILEYEIEDLSRYFMKKEVVQNINYYKEEIEKSKQHIKACEEEMTKEYAKLNKF